LGGTSVENAENITESGVKEGLLEVKPGKQLDEPVQNLLALQEYAKAEKKGRWSDDGQSHIRNVIWTVDDLRSLVEQYKQKPIDAVIEQVRDGNSVRAILLPSFYYVTVMFSGIKVCLNIERTKTNTQKILSL
jgi:staphylococcal nuclease domain-containing protein 1